MKSIGENLDFCLCDYVTNHLISFHITSLVSFFLCHLDHVTVSKCQMYSRVHINLDFFQSPFLGHSKFNDNEAISIDLDIWGLVLVKTGPRS